MAALKVACKRGMHSSGITSFAKLSSVVKAHLDQDGHEGLKKGFFEAGRQGPAGWCCGLATSHALRGSPLLDLL